MYFDLLDTAIRSLTGVIKLNMNFPHLRGANSFNSPIESPPDNPIYYNISDSKHPIN